MDRYFVAVADERRLSTATLLDAINRYIIGEEKGKFRSLVGVAPREYATEPYGDGDGSAGDRVKQGPTLDCSCAQPINQSVRYGVTREKRLQTRIPTKNWVGEGPSALIAHDSQFSPRSL